MTTILNDLVRLEIDASDVVNQIANHSAQTNTTGWAVSGGASLSRQTGLSDHGYLGTALRVSTITGTSESVTGPTFAVSPGEWVNYQCEAYDDSVGLSGLVIDFNLQFLNSGGSVIETKTVASHIFIHVDQVFVASGPAQQAPTGTVTARVQLTMATSSGSSSLDLAEFMAVKGSTAASVTGVAFTDAAVWQGVMGSSTYVRVHRGLALDGVIDVLDVGTLTAEVLDPTVDPFANSRIEKGRTVRLRAIDAADPDADRIVFTGEIDSVNVDYSGSKTPGTPTTRVTILATDAVQALRNTAQATGKSGRFKQRIDAAMAGISTIAYSVADTDSNTTSSVLTVDPNATAYDQLALVRDTLQGYLWVDADNTLQCAAANSAPDDTTALLFSDDLADADDGVVMYTDIAIRGGSDTVVNTLMVSKQGVGVPGGSRDFGPYVNGASVSTYGSQGAEVTINSGSPSSVAEDYLALYAAPRKFVQRVAFDATDDPYAVAALVAPYDAVEVKRTDIVDDAFRVLSIDHDVVADAEGGTWLCTLGLRPVEDPATITVTKPAAGDDTGPADLVTSVIDPHGRRYRTSDQNVADSTSVTVDFNVAGESAGVTWDATNKRFTVPVSGRYLVAAVVGWAGASGGRRGTNILQNSDTKATGTAHAANAQAVNVPVSAVLYLAAGDHVSVQVFQNSGGTLAVSGAENTCTLAVTYLGA